MIDHLQSQIPFVFIMINDISYLFKLSFSISSIFVFLRLDTNPLDPEYLIPDQEDPFMNTSDHTILLHILHYRFLLIIYLCQNALSQ